PGSNLRVLLVTKGNLFLERALALDPRVTLDRAPELPMDGGEGYDVVIFDGVEEQPVLGRGVLTFGSAGTSSPVTVNGTIDQPLVNTVSQHELLQTVDFRNMYIGKAEKVKAKPIGEVIASAGNNPMVVVEDGQKRRIYVAFEPMESDFPLQVGFP